jgi:arylsulfatase A-like enzyme
VNFYDAHLPYVPPDEYVEMTEVSLEQARAWAGFAKMLTQLEEPPEVRAQVYRALQDLYDGELRYVQHHAGNLLTMLDDYTQAQSTMAVIIGDHGEQVGEHDLVGHSSVFHQETLHVPLAIRWPGEIPPGNRLHHIITTLDLFATFAEAAELSPAVLEGLPTRSLLPACRAPEQHEPDPIVVTEVWPYDQYLYYLQEEQFREEYVHLEDSDSCLALFEGDWKYLRGWEKSGGDMLYNLAEDPGEQNNLLWSRPELARRLSDRLDEWIESTPTNAVP